MRDDGASRGNAMYVDARRSGNVLSGSFALPVGTSAAGYLEHLSSLKRADFGVCAHNATPSADAGIFLSVVVRTQGKRIEELMDVLLCLAAQTDDDFEVLLVGHKVEQAARKPLALLVESFPPSLTNRMSYHAVDYGTRTTPLQIGFASARGRYVAVLDDDDLVTDTWVADFKELARNHDGAMLMSYVVTQRWGTRLVEGGDGLHRELHAESAFDDSYCHDFDVASQLAVNACPLMGLAFPKFVFQDLGLSFDETLTTTEDWDFLMRVYSICGVACCDRVDSVYRQWTNAETSHTEHDSREWDVNYAVIVQKMNETPFLLGTGDVESVRAKSPRAIASRDALLHTAALLVYGEPFCPSAEDVGKDLLAHREGKAVENGALCVRAVPGDREWDLSFVVDSRRLDDAQGVSTVVFSPLSSAFSVLGEFCFEFVDISGRSTRLDFSNACFHNGYQVDCNHIVFLKEHPFVAFRLPSVRQIQRVNFAFQLIPSVPDYYIDQIAKGEIGLKIGRAMRWFARKIAK